MLGLNSIITERVLYDTDHKVLICFICKYAIKPGAGIKRYFKDMYSKTLDVTMRKALVEYDVSLSLVNPDHILISIQYAAGKDDIFMGVDQSEMY